MKKTKTFLLFAVAAFALGATEPSLEIVASSTNLVVSEQVQVSFVLRLPAVPGDYADAQPPFLNQNPPHVTCSFLDEEWKVDAFDRGDPHVPFAPEQMPRRGSRGPAFTLNNNVTDNSFAMMDDPFDMFEGMSPFGRLGPKRTLYPFTVEREADKGWRLTIAVAPWRATAPGTVRLDPVTVVVPLIKGVKIGRDRFNRAVHVPDISNIELRTKPLTFTVAEPPVAGRPASWCGAISSNLNVSASLDATVCTAGDPMILTLEIGGAANPSSVYPPDLTSAFTGTIFRIDTASLKTETLSASRRFTWRVRSTKAGTVEFPSLSVSYYDLARRAYVTRQTETIPVQVKAGLQVVLTDEEGEEFPLPDGIDLDPRGAEARPFLPHLVLAALLFLVPPVLFLCVRLAPPVRRRIAARNAAYRKAHAFGVCRRALRSRNAARRAAAIRTFFTVRYGVNGAAVTAADAQRLMAPDYPEEDIALVVTNLQAHDAQVYSAKLGARTLALVFAVGLCLGGAARGFADDPARVAFSYRRASSLAVQAKDEAGFRRAADAYRDCLDAGADNATIYQNLGACLFLAGDIRAAREAFNSAERRGGETPSTARGLKAVLAKQTNNLRAELSPARLFLKPHVYWSVDTRLLCAASLWALLWLAMLLPAGALRRFLVTACLVVFCAAAISVGVSLVEEHHGMEEFHAQR